MDWRSASLGIMVAGANDDHCAHHALPGPTRYVRGLRAPGIEQPLSPCRPPRRRTAASAAIRARPGRGSLVFVRQAGTFLLNGDTEPDVMS